MFRSLFKTTPRISPQEAKAQMENNKDIVLLDVREPDEYRERHIKGSINLPLGQIGRAESVVKNKDATIFVYCLSGGRASSACRELDGMGYTHVSNLGGIMSWPYETVSGKG